MKRLFVAFLLASLTTACRGAGPPGRLIVLALDGVDPQTVDLLIAEGKLPNFARLRREGASGHLRSTRPLLSPVIWTTVATGKGPDLHGIGHFVAVDRVSGEQLPVTSQMRRVKAVWNILSDANQRVAVVGWWATWPPEHVRGAMVSDHLAYHFLLNNARGLDADADGAVFPESLAPRLEPCISRPSRFTSAHVAPFISVSDEDLARPFAFQDEVSHFTWALAAAETHRCIGLQLWKDEQPTALMVYLEAVDTASHLFGHLFRVGELGGELREQRARYGRAVEQMYVFADDLVGRYLAAATPDTTLLVLSDHGFELGALLPDPSRVHDMRRVSDASHRLDGILYLHGRAVRPGFRIEGATILDITPTLLALQGLPAAADMPGRVLVEALTARELPRVASYEAVRTPTVEGAAPSAPVGEASGNERSVHATRPTGDVSRAAPADSVRRDPAVDGEALERLRSLGYFGATSPAGDRNLAAMRFEAGHYAEAAEEFARLVKASPRDSSLHASLAGALGAMGRYDEALEELSKAIALQPLNVEALHNRAVIHERKGDVPAAIADYQAALRYDPQYAPSQRALARLGVSAAPGAPRTAAEQQAWRLATEASAAARSGRYPEAMKKLDAAVAIAPRYALLYQYRSNVAYLMGDSAAAIAALQRGVALEPDNALFRENLRRLQQQHAMER